MKGPIKRSSKPQQLKKKKPLVPKKSTVTRSQAMNLANTARGQGTFGLTNKDRLKAGRASARLHIRASRQAGRKK
jgi:hypothetical protein